ncbi:MAG: T9SS type A sorting domain-containing protein [Bacteroidales bacterium]|nr:T9SS type A sorting domain-containing protein [Bacteroidales bacterium]MCF8455501.1 T9SS type A sorting domain-containing protein [Bacteroidales bacterium]
MKNLFLLVCLFIGVSAFAQKHQSKIIPLNKLQQAANHFAQSKWGQVGAAQAIPYYDANDNIVAYSFNYSLGRDFPSKESLRVEVQGEENNLSHEEQWGNGKYANLVMGNNLERISLIRYINALSDEYALADEIETMASEVLGAKSPVLDKIYYYSPLLKYYKYDSNGSSVYVRIFPPKKVLSPSEFQEEYVSKFNIDSIIPKAEPGAWEYYLGEQNSLKSTNSAVDIPYASEMPYLDWSFGCSPTAGGMILGYWDNYTKYSIYNYGNLSKYHYQRYDPVQAETDYNVSTAQHACYLYMGTDPSDGNTDEDDIGPGIAAAANSTNCGSYSFSQWTSSSYSVGGNTSKLNLFKGEIDNSRPCITSIPGHSVAAIGYETIGSNTMMRVHNTWNSGIDDHWNYTQIDRLIFITPGGQYGSYVEITSPNGDPAYNHNGNGEVVSSGNVWEITWNYKFYAGSYCKLYYTTDGYTTLNWIDSNTPNDGSYLWNVPSGLISSTVRVKIEVYSSTGTLIASDGSWGNFSFVTGSGMTLLESDLVVYTTANPTYYQLLHPYSTWGVVGVRSDNYLWGNWDLDLYSTNNFPSVAVTSAAQTEVDFVVFDQHHLPIDYRGVEVYESFGSYPAKTEFEGYNEYLTVGTPLTFAWPAGKIVEIWDVYLTPGTYKFTMNYNTYGAYLDMALFSSGNGQYYQNRSEYIASSTETSTVNEYFSVIISNADYYGFVLWSNNGNNSANVTILAQQLTTGIWEGDCSSDWNTPCNWAGNFVPTSTMDVIIPAGTLYSPYINTNYANAKSLLLQAGATLTIGEYDLDVQQDVHIFGTLAMNSANADLYGYSDIYWESGSSVNMLANGEFHIYGSWTFQPGSNVQLTNGATWFSGINSAYIVNNSANSSFNNVICQKSACFIALSSSSSSDLTINGDITIYAGSTFGSYSPAKITTYGSLINNGHYFCAFGTFEFGGNPAIDLTPNIGDYFNNLIVNVSTWLDMNNAYSDSLVVKGNLTIQSGILYSNSNTITVGGNWLNYVGTYGFSEGIGYVIFNGTGPTQYCYGETFYDVAKTPDASFLYFEGQSTVTNGFFCNGFTWANEDMDIHYLYLNSLGRFTANAGCAATIDNLDMGFTLLGFDFYGILAANGGQIYVGDVEENGLYGTFDVHTATGLIDITQGTGSGEYLDINGTLDITDGAMVLHGGLTCDIGYGGNAVLQMSGGVLDVQDVNISIYDMPNYSVTTNITGGIIRTPKNFTVYDIYNPGGGTLEFYGSANSNLSINNTASSIHNLHVNKTSGWVNCNTTTTRISGDVIIDGGILIAPPTLYVGKNWTNNAGTAAFNEGTGTVYFDGQNPTYITQNEEFYTLSILKQTNIYGNANWAIQSNNTSIVVQEDMHVSQGYYGAGYSTLLSISGNFTIESGTGLHFHVGSSIIDIMGDFVDYNIAINSNAGIVADSASIHFTGTTDQDFHLSCPDVNFKEIVVNKPANSTVYNYKGFTVHKNLILQGGKWDDYVSTSQYYIGEDFFVSNLGYWMDGTGTLHFEGSNSGRFENYSPYPIACNLTINKTVPQAGIELFTDMIFANNHHLTIDNGYLLANGHLIRLAGNLVIHDDGTLSMDDDSELKIGLGGYLDILGGATLELSGSQNHEVMLQSDDANFWQFTCAPGGYVSAEWATFSGVDSYGVQIFTGGIVDTAHAFNHCTFLPGQPNGVLLSIDNTQNLTVHYANFPSASGANVSKPNDWGQVTFVNYLGSFAGETYDADYFNRVDWWSDYQIGALIINYSCNGDNDGTIDMSPSGGTTPYSYQWADGATAASRSNLGPGMYAVTVTDLFGLEISGSYEIIEPPILGVSFTSSSVSCFGGSNGSIDASAYGGIPGYTFLWSTGATTSSISNLQAGTYTLTVIDSYECTFISSHTISQPSAIEVTLVSTNISCYGANNGEIHLYPSNGFAPYTYSWNDGATTAYRPGLSAGTYTYTVTDSNGCNSSGSATIIEPAPLTLSISTTNISCNGNNDGQIQVYPSYGPPYSYSWNDGATTASRVGLASANYTVTVTNSDGCTASGSAFITQPFALSLSFTSNNVSCFGGSNGSIDLSVYGGTSPYTYLWNNGANSQDRINLPAGTYTVTITDSHGCTITGSRTITQPALLSISGTVTNVTMTGGSNGAVNITVSGGSPTFLYNWSNGATTEDNIGLSAGFYNLTVIDSNGCTAYETFEVTEPAGLDVQTISLPMGWSLMSTYIVPIYPLVDSVFAPVVANTAIVKNGSGAVYWPSFNLNMIGNMIIGQGYQVKMNSAQTLAITGSAVSPESTPISIPNNWSLIGYLRQVPGDAVTMMSTIVSNLSILKDGSGSVYWPSFGLNMIGNMQSGQGYQIKLTAASVLVYPANSVSSKSDMVAQQPVYYALPLPTDNNMTLGIPETAFDALPMMGDEIGVFDSHGLLVGAGVYTGGNTAITLWGDDDLTPEPDGLIIGNDYSIRIWDGESEKQVSVESWAEGNGQYEENSIQIVGKLASLSSELTAIRLYQNIPNPFSANARISFFLPEESEITLTVFDILGNEIEVLAKGSYPAGNHTVEMDNQNYSTGTYFYRLIANDFVETKQMEVGR